MKAQVIDWIGTIADGDIDDVLAALQARHEELHEQRSERVAVGRAMVVDDLDPEYLNGLVGEITEIRDGVVSLLLTAMSTGQLRFRGGAQHRVGPEPQYLLQGVPAGCAYDLAEVLVGASA